MEEQTKIDNYLHTIEDHIMTNQITPQEFMVYYQNIKTLIISDKLSDPVFHLQVLYGADIVYSSSFNSERMIYELKEEIEQKNEEKLTRTQQLSTVKIQALRELGYNDINAENAAEVFEKMAEIQTRKV